mgnify:FL=1
MEVNSFTELKKNRNAVSHASFLLKIAVDCVEQVWDPYNMILNLFLLLENILQANRFFTREHILLENILQ